MNQRTETNGPEEEGPEAPEGGPPTYISPSEVPTVTVPRSENTPSPEADAPLPDEPPEETDTTPEDLAPPEETEATPEDLASPVQTAPEEEAPAEPAPEPAPEDVPQVEAEGAAEGWGGAERVEAVYGPLTEYYERLDARLRDVPADVPPVGWAPHVAALRALREQRGAGDWETLARFLVAPGSLPDTEEVRLVRTEDVDEVTRRIVKELAAADGRALLVAPTPERAAGLLRGLEDDPEVFSLLIETRPIAAEADSVATQAFAPVDEQSLPPSAREHGAGGTVTFGPVGTPPHEEAASTATRAEPLPGPSRRAPAAEDAPDLPGGEKSSTITRVEALPAPSEDGPAPDEDQSPSTITRAEPLPDLSPGEPAAEEPPEESPSTITRAEPLPVLSEAEIARQEVVPSAPETRVQSSALRPVGEAWRQSWDMEVRLLRRGLMSLEQWPRDAAALQAVQSDNLRRGEELEAERAGLANAIEEFRSTVSAAEQAAERAEAEAERLAAVQEEAEQELAGPRAEADRLRAASDEAAAEASGLARTADASYARCLQMDERAKTAQAELQAARQTEESLTHELARAQDALPAATEEAGRLAAADADTAAEGHAAYYRLVSAESALLGVRRKMTLGQRLHVASQPPDLKRLRAEAKARAQEADEAARRAQEAKEAAETADRVRRGLTSFVTEGGARLKAAQEAQERLGGELIWLATERESAGAEYQKHARLASEAAERATQAAVRARAAHQAAQVIADRVDAAARSRAEALAAAERIRADAAAAAARATETEATLERRTAEAAAEFSVRESDLETAQRTEARSRETVLEICGADPTGDPEVVLAHQRHAMARIEELTGYLGGGRAVGGDVLLRTADLVIGTPLGVGLTARDEEFDALIVADAGAVTDGEFLIGAVRTRRWVLVGAADSRPQHYREYADAPSDVPGESAFERAAAAAPHLLDG